MPVKLHCAPKELPKKQPFYPRHTYWFWQKSRCLLQWRATSALQRLSAPNINLNSSESLFFCSTSWQFSLWRDMSVREYCSCKGNRDACWLVTSLFALLDIWLHGDCQYVLGTHVSGYRGAFSAMDHYALVTYMQLISVAEQPVNCLCVFYLCALIQSVLRVHSTDCCQATKEFWG